MNGYRIVRINRWAHEQIYQDLYRADPELKVKPYAEQMDVLFADSPIYSNSFSLAMRQLGLDAIEILSNAQSAQEMWAKERGIRLYDHHRRWNDILLHQIAELKPDVLFYQAECPFSFAIRKTLRRRFPFIKLVVLYSCAYLPAHHFGDDIDVVIAGVPWLQKRYEAIVGATPLVYHGFDSSILKRNNFLSNDETVDISFIGHSGVHHIPATGEYEAINYIKRYELLCAMAEATSIKIWEYIPPTAPSVQLDSNHRRMLLNVKTHYTDLAQGNIDIAEIRFAELVKQMKSEMWKGLLGRVKSELPFNGLGYENAVPINKRLARPIKDLYQNKCYPPVFGSDMYWVISNSRITLNAHGDLIENNVGNMRMFEATGVGSLLLTDTGENMDDIFEDGTEVVTYSSADDCLDKAKYLLEHETDRKKIAEAGQRRTLRDHTIYKRCEQMHSIIHDRFKTKGVLRTVLSPMVDMHIAAIVTSEKEAKSYLDFSLPSQLSSGNIPAVSENRSLKYYLYATPDLISTITSSLPFKRLTGHVDTSVTPLVASTPSKAFYEALSEAVKVAAKERAALVPLAGNIIISSGVLSLAFKLAKEKRKYIGLCADIPITQELLTDKLELTCDEFEPRTLAKAAIEAVNYWSDVHPLAHGVGSEGYIVRSQALYPLFIWPRSIASAIHDADSLSMAALVDACYDATPAPQDIYVVEDSDEATILRLVDKNNFSQVKCIAPVSVMSKYLQFRYRLHFNPLSGIWDNAMEESDRDIKNFLKNANRTHEKEDKGTIEKHLATLKSLATNNICVK